MNVLVFTISQEAFTVAREFPTNGMKGHSKSALEKFLLS